MLKKHKVKTKSKVIDVKLKLPKNLEFKILGQLFTDLGCGPSGNSLNDLIEDLSEHPFMRDYGQAIRKRDRRLLSECAAQFQPQSMLGSYDTTAFDFFAKYQLGSFLKKYPEKGSDSKQRALTKFIDADRECGLYNKENFRALLALDKKHPDYLGVIREIQLDILSLLGEYPNIDRVFDLAKHGPGTSVMSKQYSQGKVTSFYKWSLLPYTATTSCIPYAKAAILRDPRWIGALDEKYRTEMRNKDYLSPIDMDSFWNYVLRREDNSRTTTVPKSAEIDRTICIEPLFNVYLQLGVDGIFRARLKSRWGYDIDDQTKNQMLAQKGSANGDYATVDLSSASDLISLKICEILLPPAWYNLLTDLRCAATDVDGQVLPLEKISSMGNGYTFALETILFGALTRCAIRRTRSERTSAVYGDDIVLPVTAYGYLFELLSLSGFRLNREKTFTHGPFRESCGMDFYNGTNVRPLFLKREIKTLPDLFYIHNALWALENRLEWYFGFSFSATRSLIRKYIPPEIRKMCYGPSSESLDTYLFSDKKLRRTKGGYAWSFRVIPAATRIKRRYKDFFFVKLMCDLRGVKTPDRRWDAKKKPNTGNAFDITKRDRVSYKLTKCKVFL